jgi:RNA-directed DNA polymerase
MTTRRTHRDEYVDKLRALNAVVRGWANYYRAVNPTATFQDLDHYVWLRLQKWLQGKYRIGTMQVDERYMRRREGPRGGQLEFVALDEGTGQWVWRFKATDTKLVHYRPRFKQHWPNSYLERKRVEPYELPTLKTMWTGHTEAPVDAATRRLVLARAKGHCERCGERAKLFVNHIHRVKGRSRDRADNRPEMKEALCFDCHAQEHRAENIHRAKTRQRDTNGRWVKSSGEPGAG